MTFSANTTINFSPNGSVTEPVGTNVFTITYQGTTKTITVSNYGNVTTVNSAAAGTSGFSSLVEVLVAITVLTIGMSAMAGLAGVKPERHGAGHAIWHWRPLWHPRNSRDLNRWPSVAPQVAIGGSLSVNTTVGTLSTISTTRIYPIQPGRCRKPLRSPAGIQRSLTWPVVKSPQPIVRLRRGQDSFAFHRSWLIEGNPVVNGVTLTGTRRVTVIVTGTSLAVQPAISFLGVNEHDTAMRETMRNPENVATSGKSS